MTPVKLRVAIWYVFLVFTSLDRLVIECIAEEVSVDYVWLFYLPNSPT